MTHHFLATCAACALVAGLANAQSSSYPSFSVVDSEAIEGSGKLVFTVRKHGRLNNSPSTISFNTFSGSAVAGKDFTAVSGSVTFSASETEKTIVVPLVNDTVAEPTETMELRISAGSNARLYRGRGTGTIMDDDTGTTNPPPIATPLLSIHDVTVDEGAGTVRVTVTRGGDDLSERSRFSYTTSNGTATDGSDYTGRSGTQSISANNRQISFSFNILEDTIHEGNETFQVKITPVSNAKMARDTAVVTITDNDPAPTPTPTPTPTKPVIVAEGDSITSGWMNYPNRYAESKGGAVSVINLAVGGSVLTDTSLMSATRMAKVLEAKPQYLTVSVGSNDLGNTALHASTEIFYNKLATYASYFRSRGIKVFVADVLPICIPTAVEGTKAHNAKVIELSARIRAGIGKDFDGIVPFRDNSNLGDIGDGSPTDPNNDACNRTYFSDGQHPTSDLGQAEMAKVYGPIMDAALSGVVQKPSDPPPPPSTRPQPDPTPVPEPTPILPSGFKQCPNEAILPNSVECAPLYHMGPPSEPMGGWAISQPTMPWRGIIAGGYAMAVKNCSSLHRTTETDRVGIRYSGVKADVVYKVIQWGWTSEKNINGDVGDMWVLYNPTGGNPITVAATCLVGAYAPKL